jgi:hypothetical protein|tara:strand:- start:269 stop:787 length:519 start_codon:yes stop_codon:yes gene_type:complete
MRNEENNLFIKPSKMIVYAAIGAMFAFMGGIVYFSTFDIPELEQSELELLSVNVKEIDSIDNRMTLNLVFGITNHGDRTVTVPEISWELFADGKSLGSSSYSISDIPLTGRALLTSGLEVPIQSEMTINLTDEIEDVYNAIAVGENLDYRVVGQYTVETAWQVIDMQFESSI